MAAGGRVWRPGTAANGIRASRRFFISSRPVVKMLLPKPSELRRGEAFCGPCAYRSVLDRAACPASKANRLVRLIKTLTVMPHTGRSGRRLKKLAGSKMVQFSIARVRQLYQHEGDLRAGTKLVQVV